MDTSTLNTVDLSLAGTTELQARLNEAYESVRALTNGQAALRANNDRLRHELDTYRSQEESRIISLRIQTERADNADERLQKVYDRLLEEAESREWCSEFDNIMEELGFPPRTHDYTVRFDVSGEVTMSVNARNEDDAVEEARRQMAIVEDGEYTLHSERFYAQSVSLSTVERDDE